MEQKSPPPASWLEVVANTIVLAVRRRRMWRQSRGVPSRPRGILVAVVAVGMAGAAALLALGLADRDGPATTSAPTPTLPAVNPLAPQHRSPITSDRETTTRTASPARAAAGAEIADRPDTEVSPAAQSVLRSGELDGRVLIVLASLAGVGQLDAVDVPPAEPRSPDTAVETGVVEIGVVDPAIVLDWLDGQPRLRPDHVEVRREDSTTYLVLVYDTPEPPGLFPS